MAHHFRAGTPNCFGFKGSRRRCVKAQGLLDPMSGGHRPQFEWYRGCIFDTRLKCVLGTGVLFFSGEEKHYGNGRYGKTS